MKFQTLIYQASYEYNTSYIALLISSSSFYNSSFAPNIIGQRDISSQYNNTTDQQGDGLLYFLSCRSPVISHTLQFIDRCDVFNFPSCDIPECLNYLKSTRYFDRSLKSLRLDHGSNSLETLKLFDSRKFPNLEELFFVHDKIKKKGKNDNNKSDETHHDSASPSFSVLSSFLTNRNGLTRLEASAHASLPQEFYSTVFGGGEENRRQQSSNLRHLRISIAKSVSPAIVLPDPSKNLQRLTRLELHHVSFSSSPLVHQQNNHIMPAAIYRNHHYQLHNNNINVSQEQEQHQQSARAIASLPQLKILHLVAVRGINDTFMTILANGLQLAEDNDSSTDHLQEFKFHINSFVSDAALANFVEKTHVTKVDFSFISNLDHRTFRGSKYVEEFIYSGFNEITEECIEAASQMKYLKVLNFDFLSVGANMSRFLMSLGASNSLMNLDIRVAFPPSEFEAVFSRFRNMEVLELHFATVLADDYLTSEGGRVFGKLEKLKSLSISGLRFEADFVRGILETTNSIEHLSLSMRFCEEEEFVPAAFEYIPTQLKKLELAFDLQHLQKWNAADVLFDFPAVYRVIDESLSSTFLHVDIIRNDTAIVSRGPWDEFVDGVLELRALQRKFPNVRCSWPSMIGYITEKIWKMNVPSVEEILRKKKEEDEENVHDDGKDLPQRRERE